MRTLASLGFAVAALCGAGVVPAAAADMSPVYPPAPTYSEPEPQFEFGTGWYLRGDVGWGESTREQLLAALPKLTAGGDVTGGVGAGYRWSNWFRTDLTVSYDGFAHQSARADSVICPYGLHGLTDQTSGLKTGYLWSPEAGTCQGKGQASLLKTDVLVNAYVDLGTWYGVTPYVGAGVGFARLDSWGKDRYTKTSDGSLYQADLTPTDSYPLLWTDEYGNGQSAINPTTGHTTSFSKQNWARGSRRTQYNLAWTLTGGIAYPIDDHLSVDLAYRYINLGSITDAGGRNRTLDAQQVRLGLRYAID